MKSNLLKSIFISLILLVGGTNAWAGEGFYGIYIKYNHNGTAKTSDGEWTNPLTLGTLTSDFKVTDVYLKVWWENWDPTMSAQLHYWKDGKEQWSGPFKNVKSTGGKDREVYVENWNKVLASTTETSGSHEITYKWEAYFSTVTHTLPSSGTKKITYTVDPPAVKSFTVTPSGDLISGSGEQDDPYIIRYNGSLTLTLSGSQNHTDANSTLQYNTSGTWNTTTSRTISNITSATKKSVTVKMRCHNSTASLSGTESSKTIYYRAEDVYTVTINNDGHGTTSPSGAQSNVGKVTGLSIKANPAANYEFVNWTITSGSGSFGSTTSASTTFKPTSAATIQANFRSTATHSLTVEAGNGISQVAGSIDPITLGNKYDIKATPETGYTFSTWTANPVANASFGSATTANTTVTVKNGSVTVTATATENTHDITILYKCEGTSIEDETTESAVGEVNAKSITAPSITGYTFKEWTLGDGITNKSANTSANPISVTTKASGNYTLTANYTAKPYYISGRLQQNWNTSSTTQQFTYVSNGQYKYETGKTVAELSAQWQDNNYTANQYFFIHAGGGLSNSFTSSNNNGHNFHQKLGYANALTLSSNSENNEAKYIKFADVTDCSSDVVIWWEPSTNKLWYTATANLNTNYYLLGFGSSNWEVKDARRFVKDENDQTKAKVTITLEQGEYKYNTIDGFKINNNLTGKWYGNNSTMTRSNCTGWSFEEGKNNAGLTADIAGDYVFTLDLTTMKLSVTYPTLTQYTITYHTNGGDEISQEEYNETQAVTLPKPTRTGYTFAGWFDNEELTGDAVTQITKGTTGDKEFWAKWTATEYTITYNDLYGVTHSNPPTYTIESETITFTNPTSERTGYTFTGWNPTQIAKGSTGNQTVTAQWNEILSTITITTNPAEGGSVTVDDKTFTPGNTVQVGVATTKKVTAVPNEGYGVATWGVSNREIVNASGGATVTLKSDGSGSTGTLTANFIGLEYTITFDKQEGTEGTDKATVRYMSNEYSVSPVEAPTRAGYTFGGYYTDGAGVQVVSAEGQWLANATDYTDADRKWLVKENTTLYAKWTANTYIVTLDQEGAAEKGDASVRADYNANMPEIGKLPTPPNGYAFMGYFDQKDGLGTQYYDSVGTSARTWNKTEDATLYAYFKAAEITINLNASTFEPGTASVTATATLKPKPVGTTSICWELLYDDDTPVAEHDPTQTGDNQVQFNINDLATGTYQIKATLREGAGCTGTIISHATQVFTITSDHTITIKYVDENGQTIKASTTQSAHVSSLTEITAVEIIGYTFKEWEAGDGVSIEDATDGKKNTATIEYNAYYDGYLKAIYTKNSNIIYFYNTLGWENVYVYFYSGDYWDSNKGTGTKSGGTYKEHLPMVRMGESNIWYANAAEKATTYLVFGKDEQNNEQWFNNTSVARRGDYNSSLPMFVPIADQEPTELNNYTDKEGKKCVTKYYDKGYWMNYPENPGYTLDLFNHHTDNDPARYFIYPYSQDTIFPLQIQVDINAENIADGKKKIWFRIHRNDGKNFGGNANTFPSVKPGTTGGFITENDYKVELITPIAGTYTFILDYKYDETAKDYKYHISVDYPAAVGDYRILYRDAAEKTWSGKDKNKEGDEIKWYHASRVIKKGTDTKDIISFFINKDIRRTLSYQTIEAIDKDGNITWSETEVEFSHVDWSQIDTSGVYNFVFVQDGRGISLDNTIEPYTGNYYIRTDAMGGGWEDYKTNSENRMTYSSFSESDANSFGEQFSHYAVKWCEAGTNVKFTIANDYSHCISDTLAQDIIPLGNLTDEGTLLNNDIYDANIRFMWNWKTNKISRAYVGPAGDKQSQFLMLRSCSEFKDAAGNDLDPNEGDILDEENDIYAARFTDTQNWIYERTIQVKPRTRVKLYASYPKVYHIYITSKSNWQDVALYAWNSENHHPLGDWPGIKPTGTVEIEGTTYYDFQVSEYVFGCGLVFHNNKDSEKTEDYTAQISQKGDYYLIEENKKLTQTKYVSTTVEATAQYFRGAYAEGSCDDEHTIQILGGEGETWNTIRVIYDFKTNRLMAAWMPNNNEIDTVRSIESDVMIIRDHQNAAQCITFANDSSKLTYVKTVYGVMRFNRWILNNRGGADNLDIESCTKVVDNQTVYDHDTINKYHPILETAKQTSQYERALYFISFPFDVHLSDVFGFGTYGQHWIIEYYDGLKRAKEGYWIDSDPNWKYVTDPANFVLEKYKGYILCLNLGKMAYDNTDFWAHNISQVELFFPSTTTMEEIAKAEVTMPKLGEEYLCKINRGDGTEGDRRVKDSYWRCIGVPSYANYSNVLKDEEGNPIQWQTSYKTFPFLYKWNKTDNTLTPQSTTNFKFETMHAYLVQNGGEIHWSAVNATPDKPNAGIIAKVKETTRNYEWRITLTQGEKEQDQAFVRLSDNEQVTTEFDFNQDLSKEFNYGRSDIYTLIGYEKAAANSLPLSEQTTLIPLGLSIEYNGDYTIAMPDGTANIGVTLIDTESNTRTNLSAGMEYTLTLKKGDYNNRFFIEISPIQQTPTDIEYVENSSDNQARKVLIDNILYIVRDGQMFDARGARVK